MVQRVESRQRRSHAARRPSRPGRTHPEVVPEVAAPRCAGEGGRAPAPRARDGATGLAMCLIALAAAHANGQAPYGDGDFLPIAADPAYDRLRPAFSAGAASGVRGEVESLARECETLLSRPLLDSGGARPPEAPPCPWEAPLRESWKRTCDIAGRLPGGMRSGPRSPAERPDAGREGSFQPPPSAAWEVETALRISAGYLHAPAGPGGFLAAAFEPPAARPSLPGARGSVLPLVGEELLRSSHSVLALAASAR